MVKALHRAGLEVILDVVFNHTTEGGARADAVLPRPANEFYYILEKDKSRYADYTGRGNTLNANQPIVRRPIQDSLRYWANDARRRLSLRSRVDPLARRGRGAAANRLSSGIRVGPLLAGTKLIAEAWMPPASIRSAPRGRHLAGVERAIRDDVRRSESDNGSVSRLATRLLGSPDIYGHEEREAEKSINFVTCHDGFTLNDLVSFNHKHNEANGENNRDGSDDNLSWNCGAEGPTDDPAIEALRNRRSRTSSRSSCSPPARRCCSWATKCAGPSRGTTTLIARTADQRLDSTLFDGMPTCTGSSTFSTLPAAP